MIFVLTLSPPASTRAGFKGISQFHKQSLISNPGELSSKNTITLFIELSKVKYLGAFQLVNPNLQLAVARQCRLLGVERSGLYYKPVPKVDDTVMMNRIYDIWYQNPCFGYRRVTKV